MRLCEFIEANSAAIIQEWEREARAHTRGRELERPALLDHIPKLLIDIAKVIREYANPAATKEVDVHADEHATERVTQGLEVEDVVRELALLRACIRRLWRTQFPHDSGDDAELLTRAIERATERSVTNYFKRRTELLEGMEQIADAAFGAEALDEFLDRLLHIFKRFAPSVDSIAILLRVDDRLTTCAAIGLEEEVRQRFTLNVGQGFAGTIAARGEPLLLKRAFDDPLVVSSSIHQRKTLALYGVPLIDHGHVIGVAHIGSCEAEDIPEPERRLFAALAQRATSAIVKHRLRAQAQRKAAELQAVMEAIPSPAFVGTEEQFTAANAAALRMVGVSDLDALKKMLQPAVASRVHMRDAKTGEPIPATETPYRRAARGETLVTEVLVRDPRTAEDRIMRGHAGPIRTDGSVEGAAIVFVDVTELHRAIDELTRLGDFRERFVAVVSHDLRNPLQAITMAAHIMIKSPQLPPTLARSAGRVLANADTITKMISDLLDFTRGRLGGGIPLAPRRIDVADVMRRVIDEYEQTNPDRSIECQHRGDTRGIWDPDRLSQVIANLLGNALRYGAPEEPVRVRAEGNRDEVTLTVHNVGPPIPPDVLPHIFDPFRRAIEQPSGGLGLGLFIAQEIVRAHAGRIRVESDERGTTFTVVLPRSGAVGPQANADHAP